MWFPKCIYRQLTGYKCPGCGTQRMFHALLHGEVVEAFQHNAFLFVSIPVLGLYAFLFYLGRKFSIRWLCALNPSRTWPVLLVLVIGWTLFRNICNW